MSRVASQPVVLPAGVEVKIRGQDLTIKGKKGEFTQNVHELVSFEHDTEANAIKFAARNSSKESRALAGTMRANANNYVVGVSEGFERKLQLVGVGYRVQAQGQQLNLTLGYSHPVVYKLPEGVSAETPSQTEIVLKSSDKQMLGQVAAEIRGKRPPEPYKGKGVRYADEQIIRKETKKK